MLNLSLKNKILLFNFLVFMVSLICFFLISFYHYTKRYVNNEIEHSLRENRLIINNIDMLVNDMEKFIKSASIDANVQSGLILMDSLSDTQPIEKIRVEKVLGEGLGNVIGTHPEIFGMTVWNKNHHIYSTYTIDSSTISDHFTDDYFTKAGSSKSPYWDGLRELEYMHFVFPITKSVISKETGFTIGSITLFFSELNISKVFEETKSPQNSYFVVDVENLQILSTDNKTFILSNFLEKNNISLNEFQQMTHSQYLLKGNTLFCYELYEKLDWFVISVTDLTPFLRAEKLRFLYFSIFLCLILVIVFIGAKVISVSVTKPLYQIISVMKKIGEGDMKCRVDTDMHDLELSNFALAFNDLIGKLEYSINKIYTNQQSLRQKDLQLIQAQVKPHFLYNVLETISSFIKLGYKDKAIQTIVNLSMLYRKSLSNGNDFVTIMDEIELVEHYLNLQQLRYKDTIQWMIEIEDEVKTMIVPKLLIQPLVENCIYHGIKPAKRQAEIVICCYLKNQTVIIEIHDNGVGIDKQKLAILQSSLENGIETSERKSFGLQSVNERLKLYFGDKASLRIESVKDDYTLVSIIIPLEKGTTL